MRASNRSGFVSPSIKPLEKGAPTHAEQVAHETRNLEIRVLERLLQTKTMLGHLSDELLRVRVRSRNSWIAGGRDKTAANQPVRDEVGQPRGIVHITLPSGNRTHVPRIRQHETESAPPRCATPASSTRPSPRVRPSRTDGRAEPLRKRQQAARGRGNVRSSEEPSAQTSRARTPRLRPCARRDRHTVDESTSTPHLQSGVARSWRFYSLQSVLRRRAEPTASAWTQYAVRHQLAVQLDDGLTAPKWWPTSVPTPHARYSVSSVAV